MIGDLPESEPLVEPQRGIEALDVDAQQPAGSGRFRLDPVQRSTSPASFTIAQASSTTVSPRSSAATTAAKVASIRRINSARRVFPIRTQTTAGPCCRTLRMTKSSSLVTITAPIFAA